MRDRNPSLRYGWVALAILFVVGLFNYLDRTILSIMQVAIKRDLGLTDLQLGSLTGLSFALFYTTLALPVARVADRISRKTVLAVSIALWTIMTAAGSLAGGFGSLLVCRIGVAAGEAGSVPTTHSLISDYFPRSRRAMAMGLWALSMSLGAMLGFALGGKLTAVLGWRQTFVVVGLSGLATAPLVLFGLKEPSRGRFDGTDLALGERRRSVLECIRLLWSNKAFRYLAIAEALQAYAQLAMSTWNAPFYSRVHHLALPEIATWLALITGLGGAAGTFFGGYIAQRLGRTDVRWYMRVPGLAALLVVPFSLLQYSVPDPHLSLALAVVPTMMVAAYVGPVNAVSQSLVPADMRAFTAASLVLVVNLIGLGLGPTITGALSDQLAAAFGATTGLRYALLTVGIPAAGACWLFFRSATHLPGKLTTFSEEASAPEVAAVATA